MSTKPLTLKEKKSIVNNGSLFFLVSNGLKHLGMNLREGARPTLTLHAAVLHSESPSCIYMCPHTLILTVSRVAWESFSNRCWAGNHCPLLLRPPKRILYLDKTCKSESTERFTRAVSRYALSWRLFLRHRSQLTPEWMHYIYCCVDSALTSPGL